MNKKPQPSGDGCGFELNGLVTGWKLSGEGGMTGMISECPLNVAGMGIVSALIYAVLAFFDAAHSGFNYFLSNMTS
jgi:hypothetical protein